MNRILKRDKMQIVVLSDVHLEFYKGLKHPRDLYTEHKCDTLVIAGDLGYPLNRKGGPNQTYIHHLQRLTKMYRHIVYVPGNHEYYNLRSASMADCDRSMELICIALGIHFLQKATWKHPDTGVIFAGCTLWSEIDSVAANQTNDLVRIFESRDDYLTLHHDHLNWLVETLESLKDEQVIVVSHHLPSFDAIGKSKIASAYATDLHHLFCKPLVAWICGHSHTSQELQINGIPLILNPIGYPNEDATRENRPFDIVLA